MGCRAKCWLRSFSVCQAGNKLASPLCLARDTCGPIRGGDRQLSVELTTRVESAVRPLLMTGPLCSQPLSQDHPSCCMLG